MPALKRRPLLAYFTFLPAIEIAGFPELEFAVAETFGFSCFGFFASLLLFLPLAMVCPFKMQRSNAELTGMAVVCITRPSWTGDELGCWLGWWL